MMLSMGIFVKISLTSDSVCFLTKHFLFEFQKKQSYLSFHLFGYVLNSNYATTVVNQEITNSSSLDSDINVLENRAKCRRQLSNRDLHSLLLKLSKERANSTQTLEILRYCTHAITEQNQCDIVNDIWNELKKCNNEFQIEHYNHMLRFAADKIDVKRAEEIFDEMIKNGIVPDA